MRSFFQCLATVASLKNYQSFFFELANSAIAFSSSYNHFHNILRIFDKHDIYELPHKLPNDLRLRILGNYEISGKSQNFIE